MRRLIATLALLAACKGDPTPGPAPAPKPPPPPAERPAACDLEPLPLRHPARARVIAIGDVHGDLQAFRAALRLAGVIDERDRWIGGDTLVVQTGDLLDRGDDEPEVLALIEQLPVLALNGNHELMNAAGDLRYVTPDGFTDYGGPDGRLAAFAPGSPIARTLAGRTMVAMVGDTVFVHGGVLPEHVDGLAAMELETRCWLSGARAELPSSMTVEDSPVWTRAYSVDPPDCDRLRAALDRLGAARMVVGHTPQQAGITSACDGAVWRIDVGLAAAYGGPVQVLELGDGREPRALTPK